MKFKNTVLTIPEIGRELNVENILEGSIQKYGDRIKITVQLVRSEDDAHLWAHAYEKNYTDLFALQDEISRAVADQLSKKLSANDINALKTTRPINLEAYEYYLKGEYIHKTNYWSAPNAEYFKESENMFLKAIDIDPNYALAYAGLADLYNTYWNTLVASEQEKRNYLKLQEKYIERAFKLDPESAKVNRVMG